MLQLVQTNGGQPMKRTILALIDNPTAVFAVSLTIGVVGVWLGGAQ